MQQTDKNTNITQLGLTLARDRIAQAYLGEWGNSITQKRARMRIDWMAQQTEGVDILDIGCSEGILAILLAREGCQVTGIDINPDAIEYGNSLLNNEQKYVQERVEFINANILSLDLAPNHYDSVIMGEIIEHVNKPKRQIELAYNLLKPDGRLVLTTPFGYFPDPDHRQTYTLSDIYELLRSFFKPNALTVKDGYIRFVGSKVKDPEEIEHCWEQLITEDFLNITEKAIIEAQHFLRGEITGLHEKVNNLVKDSQLVHGKYSASLQKNVVLQKELDSLLEIRSQLEGTLEDKNRHIDQLDKLLNEIELDKVEAYEALKNAREENEKLHNSLNEIELDKVEADEALKKALAENKKLHSSLFVAKTNIDSMKIEIGSQKKTIEERQKSRDRAALNYYTTLRSLEKVRSSSYYQMGQALSLAIVKPGINTIALPYRFFKYVNQGVKSLVIKNDPVIKTILLKLPSGKETALSFTSFKSQFLNVTDRIIDFALPGGTSCYLSSKSNSNFKEPPTEDLFCLEPNTAYELTATINLKGGTAAVWFIEYDNQTRLQESKKRLQQSGAFRLPIKTDSFYQAGCLAIRLEGQGTITFESFAISKSGVMLEGNNDFSDGGISQETQPGFSSGTSGTMNSAVKNCLPYPERLPETIPTIEQLSGTGSTILRIHANLRVACVMDEFTHSSFKHECQLKQLTPEDWQQEIEKHNPQLLFIESAWRGKNDKWDRKINYMAEELLGAVNWCKERKIPTIFWNKEDPVHFETFLNTAHLFDHVFTTDIDCIRRYKNALGHDRVYFLPFACQPSTHNPIEKYNRKDAFCFAGAYYVRYPERQNDLQTFVDVLSVDKGFEIFDRNYGKTDTNYMFPEKYKPYILGNLPFEKIDIAYKGYRYGINMNSIKQSQTMFARRAFDLFCSNTVTVSNYSRGLRNFFGDLLISTDNGDELQKRVKEISEDESVFRKFRLAGLRKVLQDHTYEDRLSYVVSKAFHKTNKPFSPSVLVTAFVGNDKDLSRIIDNYQRQNYANKRLLIVTSPDYQLPKELPEPGTLISTWQEAQERSLESLGEYRFIAGMIAEDYYGPNYIQDLVLASRYSPAQVIGKASWYTANGNGATLQEDGQQYRYVSSLPARSSLTNASSVKSRKLSDWLERLKDEQLSAETNLSIDEFNYCRMASEKQAEIVDDITIGNSGLSLTQIYHDAEAVERDDDISDHHEITASELAGLLGEKQHGKVKLELDGSKLSVMSELHSEKHQYLYSEKLFTPNELNFDEEAQFYFDLEPGLLVQVVFLFLDKKKKRLGSLIAYGNKNSSSDIPPGTQWIQLGLRIAGTGSAQIKRLILEQVEMRSGCSLGHSEYLVLSNHYPDYDNLYRNAFVHSRVTEYHRQGVSVDIFRFNPYMKASYFEFQGIDCQNGYKDELRQVLDSGHYKKVLIHFLDQDMWDVLQHYVDDLQIIVWLHGAEVQPWHRRAYNYITEEEKQKAITVSDARLAFWRPLFNSQHSNIHYVFVSRYFADEVMEDVGITLSESHYSIIHNCINTTLFSYMPKPVSQRKKILSIRPYASRKYANDLSVLAILELSQESYFSELEFRLIGDGPLFEETVAPLRQFPNVILERRFLRQDEIASLYKEYGVCMTPTRMDAQGVSRDEAMASGLVPITNRVAAIPEFVDDNCGILADPEDATGLAQGVRRLYENPELFEKLSAAAAKRVRSQSGVSETISQEIGIIRC